MTAGSTLETPVTLLPPEAYRKLPTHWHQPQAAPVPVPKCKLECDPSYERQQELEMWLVMHRALGLISVNAK